MKNNPHWSDSSEHKIPVPFVVITNRKVFEFSKTIILIILWLVKYRLAALTLTFFRKKIFYRNKTIN
jgi:hypothetical protein